MSWHVKIRFCTGETQIKLYYNDYNTEVAIKANGIVQLCTPIFQAGFLDGIGMQEHNTLSTPTAADFITSYNKFYPICSEMSVTEMDVIANASANSNYPSAAILASQANQYGQLFKCFVERSYKSGRGKIISVSKDGLNDSLTFKTLTSSSLWTPQDSCKPAFFAVVHVGQYYNELDSLVQVANLLNQNSYTTTSWSNLTAALTSATTAMSQNYSVTVSADAALGNAKDSLLAALNNLTVTGVNTTNGNNPKIFALNQNYPNPFNPSTTIAFSIQSKSFVSLKLYDVLGREVATLVSEELQAGTYMRQWNAIDIQSGVYFYRLQAGSFQSTKKAILLK